MVGNRYGRGFFSSEIEKFIIRQPPKGEKDDYDSENSWISDGLPSSSEPRGMIENRLHVRAEGARFRRTSSPCSPLDNLVWPYPHPSPLYSEQNSETS